MTKLHARHTRKCTETKKKCTQKNVHCRNNEMYRKSQFVRARGIKMYPKFCTRIQNFANVSKILQNTKIIRGIKSCNFSLCTFALCTFSLSACSLCALSLHTVIFIVHMSILCICFLPRTTPLLLPRTQNSPRTELLGQRQKNSRLDGTSTPGLSPVRGPAQVHKTACHPWSLSSSWAALDPSLFRDFFARRE